MFSPRLLLLLSLGLAGCIIDLPERAIGDGPSARDGMTGGETGADADASPLLCGNGRVDPGERCDTAIAAGQPGACPTTCDDGNVCTRNELQAGGNCGARCLTTPIAQCVSGDGCCASGCTSQNDDDCSASCGNGTVDANESCDTAIAAGQPGACPSTCDDSNACTTDQLLSGGTCSAQCLHSAITACDDGDGCCPSGCDATNDNDCKAQCGNSVVEPGEKCDPPSSCPQSCSAAPACKRVTLSGSASQCTAECVVSNEANGSTCAGGKCLAGSCCSGCVSGGQCRNGSVASACGSGGNACQDCPAGNSNPCNAANCTNGQCDYPPLSNGSTCSGGKCYGGSCCSGCWDGSACRAGSAASACGSGGASCQSCTGNDCRDATCQSGSCMTINKSDGTSCSSGNGRCYSGTCCTGCWNGSSCQPGAFDTGCGYGGVLCTVCASFQCCDVRFMPFQCSSDPMAGGPDCPP